MKIIITRTLISCLLFLNINFSSANTLLLTGTGNRPIKPIRVIAYYYGGAANLDNYDLAGVTHIIFCFGQLNGNRFQVNGGDSATITKMVSLKQKHPGLKVIVSLGGGRGCKTCSDAFASDNGRKEFASSMKKFHEYFRTDGLDLDWEFPNVLHFPGQKFSPADKKNFTALAREIRRQNPTKELSFAAGAHEGIFESVVNWKELMLYMDYVNLMTYDIGSYQNRPKLPQYRHLSLGDDSKNTAHHTALYSTPDQLHSVPGIYSQFSTPGQERSVDFCVKYLIRLGIPAKKLIIGAAFYGRMYEQVDNVNDGLYQPGRFAGTVAYSKFFPRFSADSGYVYHWDSLAKAPFLYNSSKKVFVTYDDQQSLALKTRYAMDHRLGGIMFWQLSNDSFSGGLLNAIIKTRDSLIGK